MSEILGEYLSRDPKFVPVSDITELQSNLKASGYLPPDFEPSGTYDPVTGAAFRRQERDALDLVRAGQHFGSTTVKKFFEYMAYTVPTGVTKGVVGIAKGIWDDAVKTATNPGEVLEEGGLLGGAAVGAGTGAIVGSVVPGFGTAIGALVGGAVGGVGGFFSDLFGDDDTPEEEDQDNWHKILDALTPVDEISAGQASNLFAALSTVMTASAVLKGVSLAAKGTQAAIAAPVVTGARTAGGMALPTVTTAREAGLAQAFARAAKGSVEPGMVAKLAQQGIKHPVAGGAVLGGTADALPEFLEGDFGEAAKDFVKGAATGAVVGAVAGRFVPKTATEKAIAAFNAAPIRRVTESTAGKVAQALYTGASVAGIGGRLAGELPGKQSVEREIENAPDLGFGGHVLDATVGLALYPERLLPWRARELSRGISELGSSNLALPLAEAARTVRDKAGRLITTSRAKGFARLEKTMGAGPDGEFDPVVFSTRMTFSYLNKGLNDAAEEALRVRPIEIRNQRGAFVKEKAFGEERSKLIEEIFTEMDGSQADNILEASPTARRLWENATANPVAMENHVKNFEQTGSLLDDFLAHQQADEFLQTRTRTLRGEADKPLTLTAAVRSDLPGGYQTKGDFLSAADEYEISAKAYREAFDVAQDAVVDSPLKANLIEAGDRLETNLLDMKRRGFIDEGEYQNLTPTGPQPVVDSKLPDELRDIAKTRPFEVPEETARLVRETGNDRYIALSTGENVLSYSHVGRMAEIAGITEWTKRQGFMETIASLGKRVDRMDAGKMRFNSIVDALDDVAVRRNLDADGSYLANTLYDSLKSRYDPEFAQKQGIELTVGRVKVKRRNARTGETKKEWFKIDPRDLSTEDIHDALHLDTMLDEGLDSYQVANEIKKALHVGAAYGADIAHPIRTARSLARAIRVHGFPAFNDYMRTAHVPLERFPGDSAVAKWFAKKGDYGYIGHNMRRLHMALQFSLSPTFDASRYVEAMTFGGMKDIPIRFALAPGRSIRKGTWRSPYTNQAVTEGEAYNHMIRLGDEIFHGRPVMQNFDEIQLRAAHAGVLGFKPREVEYAHAWFLAQKKLKNGPLTPEAMQDIRETVLQIHQYGSKQTMFGNSMHFTFFPFLFSFKQLRHVHDFTLSAPVRNLLVHEGVRRWNALVDGDDGRQTTLGKKFVEDFKQHVPLAKELGRLNNLSYGIGPGRFFLEGIMDKEDAGKVTQALTEFFLPGGVHQPVADAAGSVADALKHFFVPVVLMDDGKQVTPTDEILNVMERLAPVYRDIDRWFMENEYGSEFGLTGETLATLTEGTNPMVQFQELLDFKRTEGQALDAMATAAGYSSWESLSQSDQGAEFAEQVNEINRAVEAEYPSGAEMANEFSNSDRAKDQALYSVASKADQTPAEEAIAAIGLIERQAKVMAGQVGVTQEEMLRQVAPIIRSLAVGYADNRQFMNLWDEMFLGSYGPLRAVAA